MIPDRILKKLPGIRKGKILLTYSVVHKKTPHALRGETHIFPPIAFPLKSAYFCSIMHLQADGFTREPHLKPAGLDPYHAPAADHARQSVW
jgi:hypothetical protein